MLQVETKILYNRINLHIVQVFSSCERVDKRCHGIGEKIFDTHSQLLNFFYIFFLGCLLFEPQNNIRRLPTFYPNPLPPAINNDLSLSCSEKGSPPMLYIPCEFCEISASFEQKTVSYLRVMPGGWRDTAVLGLLLYTGN